MERAVIDRFVEGLAVILVGDHETEYHVPVDSLPAGSGPGSVLRVRVALQIVEMILDQADTDQTKNRIEDKLRRLRERGRK